MAFVLAFSVGALAASAGVSPASAASPASPPSAIGSSTVLSLAISPAMERTGLVVAKASTNGANALWVSHDGGSSWHRALATRWSGARPVIVTDSRGHDTLFGADGSGVQRSDDGGESWTTVSTRGGMAITPLPSYPVDGGLALTGKADYVMRFGGASQPVDGSHGTASDFAFMAAPSFPSAGAHPPALLSGSNAQNLPVILQCDANLSCSGSSTLPGATVESSPVTLVPSTGYADDGVVFAQSGRGLYKSTDGGTSYVPLAVLDTQGATATATPALVVAPGYREQGPVRTVYAAVLQVFSDPKSPRSRGGIYRSDDGGMTWRLTGSPSPLDSGASALAVAPDGRLFAAYLGASAATGGIAGLLCSSDGGATWGPACPPEGSAANDPANDQVAASSDAGRVSGGGSVSAPSAGGGAGGSTSGSAHRSARSGAAPASDVAAEVRSTRADGGGHGLTLLLVCVAVGALAATAGAIWTLRLRTRRRPAAGP